jgi:hypothetical protein
LPGLIGPPRKSRSAPGCPVIPHCVRTIEPKTFTSPSLFAPGWRHLGPRPKANGMSKHGAAAATGKSLVWAAGALAAHRHAYPVFGQWQDSTVTQALFDQRIVSPFGWPMAVYAETSKRTLLNYQHQAGGADCMRLAAIAAHEAGIHLLAPVHDSFWIAAPLAELEDAIATMAVIMVRAGRAVAGIDIRVKTSAEVRWPQCLGDVRSADAKGQAMWSEIKELLRTSALEGMARAP